MRRGIVDLPLHSGKAPSWLFKRMVELSKYIILLIVEQYGNYELLKRFSNPFFFQAMGSLLGFDWHSSGLTTTTTGAIFRALEGLDVGVYGAGGKGKYAINTPNQILNNPFISDVLKDKLVHRSKLVAKIDNSLVQDGYSLYHHAIFYDERGNFSVVQQGMNTKNSYARRYHWFSDIEDYFVNPHNGIIGFPESNVLNLVSSENSKIQKLTLEFILDGDFRYIKRDSTQKLLVDYLGFPRRHNIIVSDLNKSDLAFFKNLYELQPVNFEHMLMVSGMGAKRIRSLALIASLIYDSPVEWSDPVKYSFAHGGKDGIPFPVDKTLYDDNLQFLKEIISEGRSSLLRSLHK